MASPPQQAYQSTQDTDTHEQRFRNQNRHHDRPHQAAQQAHNPNQPMNYMPSVRAASEKKLGLLHFSSPQNHGWHGDIRKRYVISGNAWAQLLVPLTRSWSFRSSPLGLTHTLAANLTLTENRFTDFLVNEIQKNGEVLHLSDYSLGSRPTDAVSCFVLGHPPPFLFFLIFSPFLPFCFWPQIGG